MLAKVQRSELRLAAWAGRLAMAPLAPPDNATDVCTNSSRITDCREEIDHDEQAYRRRAGHLLRCYLCHATGGGRSRIAFGRPGRPRKMGCGARTLLLHPQPRGRRPRSGGAVLLWFRR